MDGDNIELADAVRRLNQWNERLEKATRSADGAQAAIAQRFVTEYTLLVADLQRYTSEKN